MSKSFYLEEIDSRLKKLINTSRNFNTFLNKLKRVSFKVSNSRQIKEDKEEIENIKRIVNTITSIVYHPHLSLKQEDIIVRSETVAYLDTYSFFKTMKDPSLRKRKRGEMIPQYVYNYDNIDNLRIYENIFICMMVDYLFDEIMRLYNTYSRRFGSILNLLGRRDVSFEDYTFLSDFNALKGNDDTFLTQKRDVEMKVFKEILAVEKKLKRIRSTTFYIDVKKARPIQGKVEPTNILLQDPLYSIVYRYYLNEIMHDDAKIMEQFYVNFVFVSLVQTLLSLDYQLAPISKRKNRKIKSEFYFDLTKSIYFYSSDFSIGINSEDDGKMLKVKVKLNHLDGLDLKDGGGEVEAVIIPVVSFDGFTLQEVEKTIGELSDKEETDRVVVFALNDSLQGKALPFEVLDFSTYKIKGQDDILTNFIRSFTTVLNGDYQLYSKHCPVCGKSLVLEEISGNRCLSCGSDRSIYKNRSAGYVWIKGFGGAYGKR
jgi:hypothetical protein